MKDIYIHSACSISIQPTTNENYFFEEVHSYEKNGIPVVDPDYKEYIPAMQLRRMGKSMRMAVYASQKAIKRAGNPIIDAVITGTGEGCLKDSEKFVEALWENEGGMINPTPFIQSTHNMAAATVALALGCKGYNMTYTNNSNSFESAVMDAHLYLNENPEHTILIGGLDEVSDQTVQFWNKAGFINSNNPQIPINLNASSQGEVVSEGTGFFVASVKESENAMGRISGIKTAFDPTDVKEFISNFLQDHSLEIENIDTVILGNNGDARYDEIYNDLSNSLFEKTPQVLYKTIIGEFDTVTSIGVEIGLKIIQNQQIPAIFQGNKLEKEAYQTILIYNQRRGKNHSLILLKK
jgi:3-oxoacyl-[acyl-carrier-protein] synthase II